MENQNQTQSFTPPRHWIGPEELEASYWADSATAEKRGQEFFEKPVETIDMIDRIDKAGIARRDFLTIMGASMAMAGMSCARRPVHKIIPYVVKPEEITPGVATWYASTYVEGGDVQGILIKNREGRPIKLEGNPDHPFNRGTLSARAQAAVLSLYDPERLTAPVMRSRKELGTRTVLSWKDWDDQVVQKLKSARAQGAIRALTGEMVSESSSRALKELLSALGGGEAVTYEPLTDEDALVAQTLSYGTAVIPHYKLNQAKVILTLGADFLGGSVGSVESAREWIKNRKLEGQKASTADQSRLLAIESAFSLTGANADERQPVVAGDELWAALAIAHELIIVQKRSRFAADAAVKAALEPYTVTKVAARIGGADTAARLTRMAHALGEAKGHGLVMAGGVSTRHTGGVALHVVANLLNSALENEGTTVDGIGQARSARSSYSALEKLIAEMQNGKVGALIISGTNPVYSLPEVSGFSNALKKVPFVVVISDREDETAQHADAVAPESHLLESWGDASPRKGVWSLVQPAIEPLHRTRSAGEIFFSLAKAAQAPGLAASSKDWHEYVRGVWKDTAFRAAGAGGNFETFWEDCLQRGGYFSSNLGNSSPRSFRSASLSVLAGAMQTLGAPMSEGQFVLAAYANSAMGDGRFANNAWLQELPDPLTAVTWDNSLNISPAAAKKLGLTTDDVVEIVGAGQRLEAPVFVQPGMHDQSVSLAIGYGRQGAGKVGNGAGVSVFAAGVPQGGRLLLSGTRVNLRKTGKRYRLATTQWHTATLDRPIINDVTLAEFRKNPASANHTDPHLRMDPVPTMWSKHEYKGYRWGMAIDLTSCIGCGACSIACQAENNIPVVGRDQVRNSRQMHWIRVDRYYSGAPENPDVVFQPMLCQHCENAPCETVCPVLATVHDDEGLNVQVYNRCVGTRYCQNNCPYKVRRFNFFDHWKAYEGTLNLAWNPDVTVRTRGIMEKCTFCVQRIRDEKDKAKTAGVKIKDGVLKTACQQTCPTDAIVFGDINDPESRVSRLKDSPQAFRVMEVLNTRPVVSYLTKVRNKEASHVGGGHHG